MAGLITDIVTAVPISLRTWISPDGRGKASIERPRLYLRGHRKTGGVVRIWPDAEGTTGLAVAEGVETALTAARGFTPTWAMLDAGNLGALPVLPGIEVLAVVVDHDPAGEKAWSSVSERWLAAGCEVRQVMVDQPGDDFADWVVA